MNRGNVATHWLVSEISIAWMGAIFLRPNNHPADLLSNEVKKDVFLCNRNNGGLVRDKFYVLGCTKKNGKWVGISHLMNFAYCFDESWSAYLSPELLLPEVSIKSGIYTVLPLWLNTNGSIPDFDDMGYRLNQCTSPPLKSSKLSSLSENDWRRLSGFLFLLLLVVDVNIACEGFVSTSLDDNCIAFMMPLQRNCE